MVVKGKLKPETYSLSFNIQIKHMVEKELKRVTHDNAKNITSIDNCRGNVLDQLRGRAEPSVQMSTHPISN